MNERKLNPIKLNGHDRGKSVLQALKRRKSEREFQDREISPLHLSELLWAANGVNREDGRHTAPSAMNKHTIDVYVMLEDGIFRYDPENHQLQTVAQGDYRKLAGLQDFVSTAPVNLIYIADFNRLKDLPFEIDENIKTIWASLDAGHNAENVYLYCASEGLAVISRTSIDKDTLGSAMKLRPEQKIILAQTIGYPT
jgi:SagB-type dehydrogenase family enzyme